MNDFTKEELEYLEEAIQFHIEEDFQQNPALSVLEKIQRMIDNYCEHESLDDYDLFLPKVGALLTNDELSDLAKLKLIRILYLATVYPEKVKKDE